MKGLETMLASMLGMKPDEMKQVGENVQRAIFGLATDIAAIKEGQATILERLEELRNGRGKSATKRIGHAGNSDGGNEPDTGSGNASD